jgi:hypothetical protein
MRVVVDCYLAYDQALFFFPMPEVLFVELCLIFCLLAGRYPDRRLLGDKKQSRNSLISPEKLNDFLSIVSVILISFVQFEMFIFFPAIDLVGELFKREVSSPNAFRHSVPVSHVASPTNYEKLVVLSGKLAHELSDLVGHRCLSKYICKVELPVAIFGQRVLSM